MPRKKKAAPAPEVSAPVLTMKVLPEVADRLDPTGDLRRAGALDLDAVPVVVADDAWTPQTLTRAFRIGRGRLWRIDYSPAYYGGSQIRFIPLDSRLVAEWLANPSFGVSV